MTGTATDARAQAKAEYDAFLAACPSRQLLDRISDKWVTLVLCAFSTGALGVDGADVAEQAGRSSDRSDRPTQSLRYSQLSRQLTGISPKMLTQTLRSLERDGMVTRTATPTVPVTVTYELTDLGLSLGCAVRPLKAWAEGHMDEVLVHRREYDDRVGE